MLVRIGGACWREVTILFYLLVAKRFQSFEEAYQDLLNGISGIHVLCDLGLAPPNSYVETKIDLIRSDLQAMSEGRLEYKDDIIRVQREVMIGLDSARSTFSATCFGLESFRESWVDRSQWMRIQERKARELKEFTRIFLLDGESDIKGARFSEILNDMLVQKRMGISVHWILVDHMKETIGPIENFGLIDGTCVMDNLGQAALTQIGFLWRESEVTRYRRVINQLLTHSLAFEETHHEQFFMERSTLNGYRAALASTT